MHVGKFYFPVGSGTAWFMLDYDYVKEYMNAVLVKLKDYVRKVDGKDDSVM